MDNRSRKRKLTAVASRVRKYRALAKAAKSRNVQAFSTSSSSDSEEWRSIRGNDDAEVLHVENVNLDPNEPQQPDSGSESMFPSDNSEEEVSNANETEGGEDREGSENSTDNAHENSDGEESEAENEDHRDMERIRTWAIKNKIEQAYIDELLLILRARLLPDLPKNAKTFLNTSSAQYTIERMEGGDGTEGEFVYLGIRKGLENCIDPTIHTNDVIDLKFSVDGLPVNQSGGDDQLWPHLCQVHFKPNIYKPFTISIFCGKSKPASTDIYFEKYVEELNELLRDGITISEKRYTLRVKCFVCDTPARAFCKNTAYHGAKNACERCTVNGRRGNLGRTVYPSINCPERTDETFRNQEQPDHHNGRTHLLQITPPIDMVSSLVLDFMHLCLGIMKKLIESWLSGDFNVRLGPRMKDVLSDRMEVLKSQVTCEFQRKPKSTKKYKNWKATEFRFFTLYCGPIVLINILPPRLYKHFLLFHVACRILCSDNLCITWNQYAKEYLRSFFEGLKLFYGEKSQTLNAHHLTHLSDDILNMGCSLSRISAFVFESFLGKMKKEIRTPYRLLAQICRRLHEEESIVDQKPRMPPSLQVIKKKDDIILKVKYKEMTICTKNPDNTVLLTNNEIFKIVKIVGTVENMEIQGFIYSKRGSIFSYPFDSSILDMFEINGQPSSGLKMFPVTSIKAKLVKMSMTRRAEGSKHFYVVPLLHHD